MEKKNSELMKKRIGLKCMKSDDARTATKAKFEPELYKIKIKIQIPNPYLRILILSAPSTEYNRTDNGHAQYASLVLSFSQSLALLLARITAATQSFLLYFSTGDGAQHANYSRAAPVDQQVVSALSRSLYVGISWIERS